MRLLVLGSTLETASILERVLTDGHEVAAVVTKEAKRRRRGAPSEPTPPAALAVARGVPVVTRLAEAPTDVELAVVVAYGRLLPAAWLETVPAVNVHYSLLPAYRGAAPVERAILDGQDVTGVSLLRLVPELDAGPLLAQQVVDIGGLSATAARERLTAVGQQLLAGLLDQGSPLPAGVEQRGPVSWAPKLTEEDLRLRPAEPAVRWDRRVRLGRAFVFVAGRRVLVRRGHPSDDVAEELGAIVTAGGEALVQTSRGAFVLDEVVPEGARPMSGAAFLRGLRGVGAPRASCVEG